MTPSGKLSTKYHTPNENFVHFWQNVPDFISYQQVMARADETLDDLVTRLPRYENIGYGWSGGKDSMVLASLLSQINLPIKGCHCLIRKLEFPEFLKWADQHRPPKVSVYSNESVDLRFLARPDNDKYLFPSDSKIGYFWTLQGTRRGQKLFAKEHDLDILVYGRTRKDGNHIPENKIMYAWGCFHYSPLGDGPFKKYWAIVITITSNYLLPTSIRMVGNQGQGRGPDSRASIVRLKVGLKPINQIHK